MEPWQRLDDAPVDQARRALETCCGARRWVERMLARRPFGNREALLAAAREEWFALGREDWLEAFAHHPKIGDRAALRNRVACTRHLSAGEQAGVDSAPESVVASLAEKNRVYEETFGYIFIVCASGKSADEMLALLQDRLSNDAETEIAVAAGEQAKITELRLLKVDERLA